MKKANVHCHNLTHETMTDEMMAALIRTLLSPAILEYTHRRYTVILFIKKLGIFFVVAVVHGTVLMEHLADPVI